jgi:hypothetical protein
MAIPGKQRAGEGVRVTVSYSDSIDLVDRQVNWSPKGVSLLTKWPFQVGAEMEFAFDHQGTKHCCTGIVVACHPRQDTPGFFDTVLYFVETPCSELQKAASDCKLAKEAASHDGVSSNGTMKVSARTRSTQAKK